MKARVIASFAMILGLAAGAASGSSIGVYFAPDGSDCDATVPPSSQVTWYILAHLYGDAATGGMTGAEFRVTGVPGSWSHTVMANPAASASLGSPIGNGCNIAFADCQTSAFLLLYTVESTAMDAQAGTWKVDRHVTPSNMRYPCPLLVLCDAPVYTKLCVSGGSAFVNRGPCTVGVETSTWSLVKGLYQD